MSTKTSSGPSKPRSSASRTRKVSPSRAKTARATADAGVEQPVDDTTVNDDATSAAKSAPKPRKAAPRKRATTARSASKKTVAATANDVEQTVTENAAPEDATIEKPKRTTRRRTVKTVTDTAETASDGAAETSPAKKPVRRTRTKAASTTDTSPEETPAPTPRKRTRKTAAASDDTSDTPEADQDATAPKKVTRHKAATTKSTATKTTRTRKVSAPESDASGTDEAEAAPTVKKAPRTRRKKAVEDTSFAAETSAIVVIPASEEEEAPAPVKKTTRAPRRRSSKAVTETDEASSDAAPKPARRTRKKAAPVPPQEEEGPAEIPTDASSHADATTDHVSSDNTTPEAHAPADDVPRFTDLALSTPILNAIEVMGYTHPTPIQAQAIPEILAGHDVLGVAQTGTGKTASFTLPLLEKLSKSRARARMPRSLILEPTRELALQVAENFERYGANLRLTHALLIGGGSMNEQRDLLNRGVDVLIATPGRLLDMFERGGLLLTQTDLLVIDEADRMLDMGFIPDIERIVSLLPRRRQTLFFSATMAPEIRRLADNFLNAPKEITVARESSVASTITEGLLIVEKRQKNSALSALLRQDNVQNAIIFCNRKRDVDMLQSYLTRQKFSVGHLHGDLTQTLRFETLERFRSGELQILVCSDVAARGIDIGGLSHVFNYDLPFNAEDYVHRIGRTGRAGKEGIAYSLATPSEHKLLEAVEALTNKKIEPITLKGFPTLTWEEEDSAEAGAQNRNESKRGHARSKRHADTPQEPRQGRQKATDRDLLPEARKHDHRRSGRPELLPPVPEKNGIQDGFGEHVPAFMRVSFIPEPREPSEQ